MLSERFDVSPRSIPALCSNRCGLEVPQTGASRRLVPVRSTRGDSLGAAWASLDLSLEWRCLGRSGSGARPGGHGGGHHVAGGGGGRAVPLRHRLPGRPGALENSGCCDANADVCNA